jgi:hypothetical protein
MRGANRSAVGRDRINGRAASAILFNIDFSYSKAKNRKRLSGLEQVVDHSLIRGDAVEIAH